jgi:hypothetical protein
MNYLQEVRGGALNFRTLYTSPSITKTWAAERAKRDAERTRIELERARRERADRAAAIQGLPLTLEAIEGTPLPETGPVIPRFEISATTPRGTPSAIPIVPMSTGVPYNAIRASSVVQSSEDFTPRGTVIPFADHLVTYSKTFSTVNHEINLHREQLNTLERRRDYLRGEVLSNPEDSRSREEFRQVGINIDNIRRKLQQLMDWQNAGFGDELIQMSRSLEFPQDYTPPSGSFD